MAWTRFSRDQLGSITYACNTRMLQGQKENWVNCNGPIKFKKGLEGLLNQCAKNCLQFH